MRIDRYVHDERLTWGAALVLLVVTALHAAGIGRLLLTRLESADDEPPPPIFQVSLLKLPPPRLPPEVQQAPDTATDAVKQRPRITRPVPILVDTPTTNPVPPDTQVKRYEVGDELLPGEPGPPMPAGTGDGDSTAPATAQQTPVHWKMKLLEMKPPVYPPRCLRLGIEGTVRLRVLVGEDGRPQDATIGTSSGDAGLDQAALDAVRTWRFEPAKRDGVPLRAWCIVPITFSLQD
ncbi:MAG: energy transducer TonB [Proteobacteria bacterium]|nr:energy transducer TonB [Pseudomonadota bacterium]